MFDSHKYIIIRALVVRCLHIRRARTAARAGARARAKGHRKKRNLDDPTRPFKITISINGRHSCTRCSMRFLHFRNIVVSPLLSLILSSRRSVLVYWKHNLVDTNGTRSVSRRKGQTLPRYSDTKSRTTNTKNVSRSSSVLTHVRCSLRSYGGASCRITRD